MALLLCLTLLVAAAACAKTEADPSNTSSGAGSGGAADVPADRRDASSRTGNNATTPLVISTLQPDGKFNPFYATSAYDTDIVAMTQLELITSNENAEPVAGLNEKTYALSYTMTVAEDQSTSTYEFILKNGLTFAHGTPVTGKDLLFSIYEYLDPAYSGSGTLYSMNIQGRPLTAIRCSAMTLPRTRTPRFAEPRRSACRPSSTAPAPRRTRRLLGSCSRNVLPLTAACWFLRAILPPISVLRSPTIMRISMPRR